MKIEFFLNKIRKKNKNIVEIEYSFWCRPHFIFCPRVKSHFGDPIFKCLFHFSFCYYILLYFS